MDEDGDDEKQKMLEDQALRDAKEEAAFQKLMKEVFGGMKGESGVMKDVTELLNREKNNHDDKQVAMYKQWERHVYHQIQDQIAEKLKKLSPDQISKKLRKLLNRIPCDSPHCLQSEVVSCASHAESDQLNLKVPTFSHFDMEIS